MGAAQAGFVTSYEAAGVQNTTATFSVVGVETFNSLATTGNQTFTTNFGMGSALTATYTGLDIANANIYGGAGGTGKYASTASSYTIALSQKVNYFGYWLSAQDAGNVVDFYDGFTLVGSLNPTAVLAAIGSNQAYFGNPNANFPGQASEAFVFVNFYGTAGTVFDRIVLREMPLSGGYESDNHTVGLFTTIGGNVVPEPASLALCAFALAGLALQRVSGQSRRPGLNSR